MANHYRTATTIFVIILLGAFAIAELDTNDIDDICNTNGATMQRIAGTWQCNTVHYGEMYFHNDTDAKTITISDVGVWYQIQNLTIGNCRGMSCTTDTLTLAKNTTYQVDNTVSFTGGANSEYQFSLFLNGIEQTDCEFHRVMGNTATIGVGTFTCLKSGLIDATMDIRVKDNGAPAQDVSIYAMNINVVEIQ